MSTSLFSGIRFPCYYRNVPSWLFQLNQRGYRGPAQFISFGPDTDAKNEYDPLKPNDYEKVVKGKAQVSKGIHGVRPTIFAKVLVASAVIWQLELVYLSALCI